MIWAFSASFDFEKSFKNLLTRDFKLQRFTQKLENRGVSVRLLPLFS